MSLVVISGSAGLVGSEAVRFFHAKGWDVIGVDNDMRSQFFGSDGSTTANRRGLENDLPRYRHMAIDIRNSDAIEALFQPLGRSVVAVIHAAAQPSHDWAARDPHTDFAVNALGTLNLLEATRVHSPGAAFVFTSTNKVYGDTPNRLPLVEEATRYSISPHHPFASRGIDETMSIDQTLHSLFGISKTSADLLVQEYGRYFGLATVCFRAGCLTGPAHAAVQLHGFLAYLVRSCVEGRPYSVFGYKAKQVRDNLHAHDLVEAIWQYIQNPRPGEVYNIGGGMVSNCSMLEAIELTQHAVGRPLSWTYQESSRVGDHIWWISDVGKFQAAYPAWTVTRDLPAIIDEIAAAFRERV
jgi:CDP-paratose 2-epimerase